MELKIS